MPTHPTPTLTFTTVHAAPTDAYDTALEDASFSLNPGDLILITTDPELPHTPFADLARGQLAPDHGAITFLTEDWQLLPPGRAAALRGQIGTVFTSGGWLSNLDVDENITLAQRYHGRRPDPDIAAEALALAQSLGLDALPTGRPHTVPRDTLRRAQWVRALLGNPQLIIAEPRPNDAPIAWVDRLAPALTAARAQGTAILWLTANPTDAQDPRLKPTLKFDLKGTRMLPAS